MDETDARENVKFKDYTILRNEKMTDVEKEQKHREIDDCSRRYEKRKNGRKQAQNEFATTIESKCKRSREWSSSDLTNKSNHFAEHDDRLGNISICIRYQLI